MRTILQILLLGVILSCNKQTDQEISMIDDELEVINQVFVELIGDELWNDTIPSPLSNKHQTTDNVTKLEKPAKNDIQKVRIFLTDTLFSFEEAESLEELLKIENFENNFPVDSSWIKLIKKLTIIGVKLKFDIKKIKHTDKYIFMPAKEFNDSIYSKKAVNFITFSRVAFDENKNRGVFYYSFYCGRLCAWGVIVFVEKKGNKWIPIGQREMWVS